MPPKEKARDVVDKLYQLLPFQFDAPKPYNGFDTAKQCALLSVGEVIKALKQEEPDYESKSYWHLIDYYEQVKEEIEKLESL